MRISKTFRFEAAHRLTNSYTQRCRGLHGHSYRVEVVLGGLVAPSDGMVMDFSKLKETLGEFIDRFDHAVIVAVSDSLADERLLPRLNPRYIITRYHPTAEMFAEHFFDHARLLGLPVCAVRVHETDTSYAECDCPPATSWMFKETIFSAACVNQGR